MKEQNKKKSDTLLMNTELEIKKEAKEQSLVRNKNYQGTERRLLVRDEMYKGTERRLVVSEEMYRGAERRLRTSEEIYRRLFETARDGILILDSSTGGIKDVNPFLIQLLGYSKEEFLRKKLWEVGFFKNTQATKDIFKILQETGYVRYENLPLEANDGRLIEVECICNAYMAGDVRVAQCNIRDISERKRIEIAEKAIASLEQEQLKVRFIADATHELRTPLAIIKGNVELALRDKSKKMFPTKTFRAINVEINHLAGLLSDLTILTRENDDFQKKIVKHTVPLSELILSIVEKCAVIAATRKITLRSTVDKDCEVLGDEAYLEKLFSNIISNAIFYGKEGGLVVVTVKKDINQITALVADNGIGIPEEEVDHIFKRFYRADNARVTNPDGTGLGLAISKWIVEAHGGTIKISSTVGKGTTATIVLPVHI